MEEEQELDPATYEAITRLCEAGDRLAEARKFKDALAKYHQALALVPEPETDWEASTWILGAIGDAQFLSGAKPAARDTLARAMACPGAIGNPFLHMRYGQVLFDAGQLDHAADELMRAYAVAGAEVFADEDRKYMTFLRTRAALD